MCTISVHPERPSTPLRMNGRRVFGTIYREPEYAPFDKLQDERSPETYNNEIRQTH